MNHFIILYLHVYLGKLYLGESFNAILSKASFNIAVCCSSSNLLSKWLEVSFSCNHDKIIRSLMICWLTNHPTSFLSKAVDGLPGPGYVENSKDGTNWKPRIQKPLVIVLEKGSVQGELKPSEKNDVPAVCSVNPKDATPVTEEQAKSSIGNGC